MYVCMDGWMDGWIHGLIFLTYSTYLELLPLSHIFLEKVCHHILKQINNFAWRYEVRPLNYFFFVQNLISSDNPISM